MSVLPGRIRFENPDVVGKFRASKYLERKIMEAKNRAKRYFKTLLNIAAGAGAVIGGTYIFSRIKEKQDADTRLERMEQIIDEIAVEDEEFQGKKFKAKEVAE
ncbi:hypothetical protein HKBW3S03_01166 [Candidatus Hakubella thermalkaliphila]|uniref:Uncharacterized protein n=2 Tax=Candidatus Hakubella thermalkaliphila TaxID=2754717 RepID=A0A6V8QG93_9ACTN|nr:hypothetical protein [Candidatus Hakubella thermalkaliphila]GFP19661.1 hypothetical protein HKBW3S03_01166 [Candidatus Hakubella thermalkaliphila]GFP24027.1 hypothetical protein HKBW3S09_01493 [Candidatus Hakubella thermalkaliphila]GFP36661.1 hypothetical protein HKBW3S44_00342 [Candidatus Hakubella thermalkaliphila]GFP39399.1 hypothetical protein HKBW3S47_01098 [Candidatus Hakubella thermalkaliphila]GFP42396.1 hypothetical protein HKBW3C_01522 [Candidatus Hakubella thermalkaliphila]